MNRCLVLVALLWMSATATAQTANEKLLAALRNADAASVRTCLSDGAEVSAADEDGVTALMYATLYARPAEVEGLLQRGADPNAKSKAGVTALLLAIGSAEKVRLLLSKGAEVNATTPQGQNALAWAAAHAGSVEIVKLLLAHRADIRSGNPLAAAARSGDLAVVKLLLARGAAPNSKTRLGSPPVVSVKRAETLRQLMRSTPLPPLQTSIPTLTGENPPLMIAAAVGHLAVAQLLVARGAEVNATGNQHTTPLMMAAIRGDARMVKWLLAQGADVKFKNDLGYTALLFAAATEQLDPTVVKTLLAQGAEVNAQGKDGETALKLAARKGNTEIVRLLAQAGAK